MEEQVSITQLPYMGDKLVLGDKFKIVPIN